MLRFINSFDTFGSSIRPHGATIFESVTIAHTNYVIIIKLCH